MYSSFILFYNVNVPENRIHESAGTEVLNMRIGAGTVVCLDSPIGFSESIHEYHEAFLHESI